ncbi:MAG: hypothetical protein KKE77_12095 [Alphaproteobacteria bacterium]|nr:hypothetical protein [Alphaproteobacteria bacterium]
MTVQIADTPLTSAFALSETGRLVMGLIDGGLHWLDYAIAASDRTYAFPDESTLVAAVQSGLHASRLMLVGGVELPVAPVKLMTMNPRELQLLRRAAVGEIDPHDPQVREILARHRLATISDLAAVDELLEHLEVAEEPLFQTMTLDERLTLLALQNDDRIADPGKPDLRLEAAQFALDQAGSPVEFADYLRAFLDLMRNLDDPFETPEERYEQAERAVYTLGPLMFATLDCPDAPGLVGPIEVEVAIGEWMLAGRQLGFLRVSQGIQQIIGEGGYTHQGGLAAELAVRSYLDRANRVIQFYGIGPAYMQQDGATCLFPVGPHEEAVVRLDPTGAITLARFDGGAGGFVDGQQPGHLGEPLPGHRPPTRTRAPARRKPVRKTTRGARK